MRDRGPSGGLDATARAWLALATSHELAAPDVLALVERLGSPEALLAASTERLIAAGATAAGAAAVGRAAARVDDEARALVAAGATLVTWSDGAYPARLRAVVPPPLALAVRGSLAGADEVAVAVVGTRHPSAYGRRVAEEIAGGLAAAGVTVVSGLAAGIDGAAHRAALEAGGRTVAVLGTGIDRVYPAWHAELADAIVRQGALLSEFPCGAPPRALHFPRRNRLISGLALATVVVEARERSGSLVTARCALEQGRDVLAVPGPVGVATHRGPHRLIRDGARLVTSAADVLEEVAPALTARLARAREAAAEARLTAAERRILGALGTDGDHVDEVIRRARVPAGPALETLLALELRGLVSQLPGKRFCRRAA
jgi:DNA processing protein